jgi:hypothetical protein
LIFTRLRDLSGIQTRANRSALLFSIVIDYVDPSDCADDEIFMDSPSRSFRGDMSIPEAIHNDPINSS